MPILWPPQTERNTLALVLLISDHERHQGAWWMHFLDPGDLNDSLRIGVPSALSADIDATYWGRSRSTFLSEVPTFLGCAAWDDRNRIEARAFLNTLHYDCRELSARQLCAMIRGPSSDLVLDSVPQVPLTDLPPDAINVFGDGSLKSPSNHLWHLGGFGVWWVHRSAVTQHSHSNEDKYYKNSDKLDFSVRFSGALEGHRCSSTRVELAAGIMILCAPGLIHMGEIARPFCASPSRCWRRLLTFALMVTCGLIFRPWFLKKVLMRSVCLKSRPTHL